MNGGSSNAGSGDDVSTVAAPVIAKTRASISAGDHTLKTALLMTISGGAIVPTGQTVQIRNVGSGAVAADTVVCTEPCGKLGQCFARNVGNPLSPVYVTWSRSQTLVSPLNSDSTVAGYDRPWTFGVPWNLGVLNLPATSQIWQLLKTPDIVATEGTAGNPRWVVKMRPIRYRIGDAGFSDQASRFTRQYLGPQRETAFSSESPPAAGHHSGAITQSVVVQPPIATVYNSALSAVTHIRVLKNGTDISGVVSVNSTATLIPQWTFLRACRLVTVAISPQSISSDDVIEVDYWYKLSVTQNEGWYNAASGIDGRPVAIVGAGMTSRDPRTQAFEWRAVFNGINAQAKQYVGDVYRLTFNANGPGGATTLDLQAQANWSFVQTTSTSILMTKTSGTGTGEWVSFNWGREIPELRIKKNTTPPYGTQPIIRVLPASSGDYEQIDSASTPGIWNPLSTTTFSVIGLNGTNFATLVNGFFDSSVFPASYFTAFPSSVTVQKV